MRDPEDLSRCRYQASDNDGLWTALTVVAESFRYAVTGEEQAQQLARKSMRALLELVYKSGAPGFPARAIARIDEEVVVPRSDDEAFIGADPPMAGAIDSQRLGFGIRIGDRLAEVVAGRKR